VPIPPDIEWLTGITNEMVRAAPPFEMVAQDLIDRLDGAVFVAHNARFDYGFLRAEFGRAGLAFQAKTLCTVRLSRALYPDRAPHSLDALIERFNLTGEERIARSRRARAVAAAAGLVRAPSAGRDRSGRGRRAEAPRPAAAPAARCLDAVPHAPGVYLFYGLNEHPIYIGKSVDVRARVASTSTPSTARRATCGCRRRSTGSSGRRPPASSARCCANRSW